MTKRGVCAECRKSVAMLDRARPTLHLHVCKDGRPSRGIEVELYKKLTGQTTLQAVR